MIRIQLSHSRTDLPLQRRYRNSGNSKLKFKKRTKTFLANLGARAMQLAPKTVGVGVAIVKTFYRVNNVALPLTRKLGGKERCLDRAPTPEELQRIVDIQGLYTA
jgi:hypothetical protein